MKLLFDPADEAQVSRWAAHFDLQQTSSTCEPPAELHLRYQRTGLCLCKGPERSGVLVSNADIQRRLRGDFALGRACGAKPGTCLKILDVTAGLGIDALALSARGNEMLLVERNVVLWAMLDDCLGRLGVQDAQLTLGTAESELEHYLEHPGGDAGPDVVYVDPMFVPQRKKALPGKRMQYLRELLGPEVEADLSGLIELACRVAGNRVVLKRRRRDPLVVKPDWQIEGSAIRFDVYRSRAG